MAPTNTNLRQKGSRIQAFATSEPLEDDYQTALIAQEVTSDDIPADEATHGAKPDNVAVRKPTELSRQQLADSMKMPLPGPTAVKQHTDGHQRDRSTASQRGYGSPSRPRHASPRPTQPLAHPRPQSRAESSVNGLFAGSNLGEDFMRSTMTSPSNDTERDHVQMTEAEKESQRQDVFARYERTQPRQHPAPKPRQILKPDNRGYLSVVQQGKTYGASRYNDGFATDTRRGGKNDFDDDEEPDAEPEEWQNDRRQPQVALRGERRRLIKPKEDRVVNVTRFEPPQRKQSPHKRPEPRQQSPLRQVDNRRSQQYQPPPEIRDSQPLFGHAARPYQEPQATEPPIVMTQDWDGQSSDEDIKQVTPKARKSKEVRVHGEADQEQTAKQLFVQEPPPPQMNKRYRDYGDYGDDALDAMSFSDLKAQPFDFDPSSAAVGNGVNNNDQPQDIPSKLDQRRQLSEQEQKQFFAAMPIEEWEDAGDWFLEQFGALMQKMRDARREKRKVIGEFEEEAERREEEVRKRSEGLEKKLGRMRQDGAKVIGDAQ